MNQKQPNNTDYQWTCLSPMKVEEIMPLLLDVRQWWQGFYHEKIEGPSDVLNKEFTYQAGDGLHFTRQKLKTLTPNKQIVWEVTESKLTFLDNPEEWLNSQIQFQLAETPDGTELLFLHQGLQTDMECYDACSSAWTLYLEKSLKPLLKA